jgi:DNA-binding NarL/FixJ family response regulator
MQQTAFPRRFPAGDAMARIIVADDHVLIREGVRKLVAGEPDLEVVAEASDFAGLLALVDATPADLVLMDIHMPGAGALDALRQIRVRRPYLPVMVLSMLPEEEAALDFLIAGAAGYISKEAAANDLIGAIRKVLGGYRYISPALAQRLSLAPPSHALLSPRELEVLRLIASGLAVKEVAARLSLSVSTVHTHRARVLQKLRLRSDVELARYAVAHRLVR